METLVNERGMLDEKLLLMQKDLEAQSEQANHIIDDIEVKLTQTRQENQRQNQQQQQLQMQLHQLEKEYGNIQQSQSQQQERLKILKRQVQENADKIKDYQQQIADIDREIETLSDDKQLFAKRDVASAKIEQLNQKLRVKNTAIDQLKMAMKNRDAEISNLKTSLQEWATHLKSSEDHIARLLTEQQEIQNKLQENNIAPEAEKQNRQKILDMIADNQSKIAKLQATITQQQEENTALRQSSQNIEQEIRGLQELQIRADEGRKINQERLDELIGRIQEDFSTAADNLPDKFGFSADEKMPNFEDLKNQIRQKEQQRDSMGEVNLRADIEQAEVATRIEEIATQSDDLNNAIAELEIGIKHLNQEARKSLLQAFEAVNNHFGSLFTKLFSGGKAVIKFDMPDDPLNSGLEIFASPPGKKMHNLSLLSGGEQALTALSLIFAVFMTNPSPICILDEVDAPLDDDNVRRLCELLESFAEKNKTCFIVVTHHRMSMSRCLYLYGVTMSEKGVSQMVTVDMEQAIQEIVQGAA